MPRVHRDAEARHRADPAVRSTELTTGRGCLAVFEDAHWPRRLRHGLVYPFLGGLLRRLVLRVDRGLLLLWVRRLGFKLLVLETVLGFEGEPFSRDPGGVGAGHDSIGQRRLIGHSARREGDRKNESGLPHSAVHGILTSLVALDSSFPTDVVGAPGVVAVRESAFTCVFSCDQPVAGELSVPEQPPLCPHAQRQRARTCTQPV